MAFDPTNKEHRRYYAQFLKMNTWGYCPVRFIITDDPGMDLPTMIQAKLVEHYVQLEFKSEKLDKKAPVRRRAIGLTCGGFELTM